MAVKIEITDSQDCVRLLREMADQIEAGQSSFREAVVIVHSDPIVCGYPEQIFDARYMGTSVVFTSYPRPLKEKHLRDAIEGR